MTGLLNGVRSNIDDRAVTLAVSVALSVLFAALVTVGGIPALRQDWAWPTSAVQIHRFLIDTWSGWNSTGIGAPAPYPSSYLLGVPLYILLLASGPKIALYGFLLAIGLSVTLGTRTLLNSCDAGAASAGIIAFALFNSWVYTKVVAGHLVMVLAYGATLFLIAFLLKKATGWKSLLAALAAIFGQLQFFLIAMALMFTRFRQRNVRIAWLLGLVLFLPSIAGVAANWGALSDTPYMLTWQQSQSVAPFDAAFLIGYFAGYAHGIGLLARVSTGFAIAAALLGFVTAWRSSGRERKKAVLLALLGITAFIAATGTKGPAAAPYAYAVQAFPVTGLFRELFDLLGYLAIVYVALSTFAARYSFASVLTAIAGLLAVLCWFVAPVSAFFVPHAALLGVSIGTQQNTRYAVYPAFQPMSYRQHGSGLDPDAYIRDDNVTPLNPLFFQYPESVALLKFQETGASRMLGDLSVATIVGRPWLESSYESLRDALGSVSPSIRPSLTGTRTIAHVPELALAPPPQIASIANDLASSNVFFGDTSIGARTFRTVHGTNATIDASKAWVDARLTFFAHPRAAQSFGGAATSSKDLLSVTPGTSLLVYVQGRLETVGGILIASSTKSYLWTAPLPQDTDAIECFGYCIVAGAADAVPRMPANPLTDAYSAVHFRAVLPWLIAGTLPPTVAPETLRYNVRYNRGWIGFVAGRTIPHVRIDHLLNGWIVPPSANDRGLVLIDAVALIQTIFEVLGMLVILSVLGVALFHRAATRRDAI